MRACVSAPSAVKTGEHSCTGLHRGFAGSGFKILPEVKEQLLDLAEDVPFNIPQLANMCWRHSSDAGHCFQAPGERAQGRRLDEMNSDNYNL